MNELPDFDRAFDHENAFYLTCEPARIGKFIAHYELFKMSLDIPGAIVECGVFVGASLMRFAAMRQMFGGSHSKKLIGFDAFGQFPDVEADGDRKFRDHFIKHTETTSGLSVAQISKALHHKGIVDNFDLIASDVVDTIPKYADEHPEMRISLLNIDTCTYNSCLKTLENLYSRVSAGGIVVLDDYAAVDGETRADEEFFAEKNVTIRKLPYARSPCYFVKPNIG